MFLSSRSSSSATSCDVCSSVFIYSVDFEPCPGPGKRWDAAGYAKMPVVAAVLKQSLDFKDRSLDIIFAFASLFQTIVLVHVMKRLVQEKIDNCQKKGRNLEWERPARSFSLQNISLQFVQFHMNIWFQFPGFWDDLDAVMFEQLSSATSQVIPCCMLPELVGF